MTFSAVQLSHPDPGEAVALFVGEHDLTTSADTDLLLEKLVGDYQLVTVDLTQTTFIDSSFLHSLVKADRDARTRGTRLRIRLAEAQLIEQVLQLSGLIDRLDVIRPDEPQDAQPEDFSQAASQCALASALRRLEGDSP